MAQPSTQQQLLAGNASEYFWYAQGAGMYDARNNAMLTKTGSAGMSTEGGANVVLGDGATHYSLPAAISTAQPWTIIFKARIDSATGTDCMVCGDTVTGNDFVRYLQDTGQVRILANGSQVSWLPQTFNALATWALVSSGTTVTLYKDGVAQGAAQAIGSAAPLKINRLLDGYPGGTFRLKGALEFVNVIPSALDAAAIASRTSDPYAVLASSGASNTIAASTANAAGAVASFSAPKTAINATAANVAAAWSSSTGAASCTIAATAGNAIGAVTSVGNTTTGTFISEALRDNVGNLIANKALNFFALYTDTTGALVVRKTGLSTNGAGVVSFSDVALVSGTVYRADWEDVDGKRRMPRKAAT